MPSPLLHWDGCVKESIHSIPSPRGLAAAAILSGEEYVALLESGGGLQNRSRFTFLALGARDAFRQEGIPGVYRNLGRFLEDRRCDTIPCRDMAVFTLSYDSVGDKEDWLAPRLGGHHWPIALAFEPEKLMIYDHAAERVISCPRSPTLSPARGQGGFRVEGKIYSTTREVFEDRVTKAIGEIERGEAFQIVLSRVERLYYKGSLFTAYLRLAGVNPSPYMYYMKAEDLEIFGTSPELLIKLDKGRLETHPIAGTRPRARGSSDVCLEEELLGDEKEVAEHIMLVDLARNDLASIAEPGTVEVTSFMDIEKYSHVMHIVSRVEAKARAGLAFYEAVSHTLPAGTVSGAPKPRAMEIISRLEPEPRGPYAGAVGIGGSNAGEAAIIIRSGWTVGEGVLEIRAGAGIVYDSKPSREFMETEYKLAALRRILKNGSNQG
ncbi:anthranilate synthase component I family protein [Aeropyrum camini]|uniref:anthranilate synthase component I family protein n=1 Tax=Aeropyrum camini TaxID=229980 RepID=UPI000A602D1E|nr:anthranilate synthase component I family protein [Aeropyrum camini]